MHARTHAPRLGETFTSFSFASFLLEKYHALIKNSPKKKNAHNTYTQNFMGIVIVNKNIAGIFRMLFFSFSSLCCCLSRISSTFYEIEIVFLMKNAKRMSLQVVKGVLRTRDTCEDMSCKWKVSTLPKEGIRFWHWLLWKCSSKTLFKVWKSV